MVKEIKQKIEKFQEGEEKEALAFLNLLKDVKDFYIKIRLIVNQMLHASLMYPNCESITFRFSDDRADILQAVKKYLEQFPSLIPPKVKLELWQSVFNDTTATASMVQIPFLSVTKDTTMDLKEQKTVQPQRKVILSPIAYIKIPSRFSITANPRSPTKDSSAATSPVPLINLAQNFSRAESKLAEKRLIFKNTPQLSQEQINDFRLLLTTFAQKTKKLLKNEILNGEDISNLYKLLKSGAASDSTDTDIKFVPNLKFVPNANESLLLNLIEGYVSNRLDILAKADLTILSKQLDSILSKNANLDEINTFCDTLLEQSDLLSPSFFDTSLSKKDNSPQKASYDIFGKLTHLQQNLKSLEYWLGITKTKNTNLIFLQRQLEQLYDKLWFKCPSSPGILSNGLDVKEKKSVKNPHLEQIQASLQRFHRQYDEYLASFPMLIFTEPSLTDLTKFKRTIENLYSVFMGECERAGIIKNNHAPRSYEDAMIFTRSLAATLEQNGSQMELLHSLNLAARRLYSLETDKKTIARKIDDKFSKELEGIESLRKVLYKNFSPNQIENAFKNFITWCIEQRMIAPQCLSNPFSFNDTIKSLPLQQSDNETMTKFQKIVTGYEKLRSLDNLHIPDEKASLDDAKYNVNSRGRSHSAPNPQSIPELTRTRRGSSIDFFVPTIPKSASDLGEANINKVNINEVQTQFESKTTGLTSS